MKFALPFYLGFCCLTTLKFYHKIGKKSIRKSDEKCAKYYTLFSLVKLTGFVSNLKLNYHLN